MSRIACCGRVQLSILSIGLVAAAYGLFVLASGSGKDALVKGKPAVKPWEFAAFEERLLRHQDLTYDELEQKIRKPRNYVSRLSFDPTKAEYFATVADKLKLTPAEIAAFKNTGFVSLDMNARHCMVSAYEDIYMKDLPVLVTTDSILHALHCSFDKILMELEKTRFQQSLQRVLAGCQEELKKAVAGNQPGLAENCQDVDLFLTVAANLERGAGAKDTANPWDGKLRVTSVAGVDTQALRILNEIAANQMAGVEIYGGKRTIDYTQFTPRGHYTKDDSLRSYFRTMIWLGRADTGWFILPVDPASGVVCDDQRELRNSMLLIHLLDRSGSLRPFQEMDDAINFLVGRSDNLSVFQLRDLMKEEGITTLTDIAAPASVKKMQQALRTNKHHRPMIVSMVLHSDPGSPGPQVPAPAEFHLFGQRFAMDSFVLSQVVFDTIVYKGRKMERRLPTGIDAMVALGNTEALPLLRGEIAQWQYSANLLACKEFVDGAAPAFWQDSLYNVWLDSIRTFNTDRSNQKHFPQAMKTQAWQLKELQTQLASWAELRHDTILYVKQSYSRASCEYPSGYVEPYPEFYAKVKQLTDKANTVFGEMGLPHYSDFFKNFSATMAKLEGLAKKELQAEAFTMDESEYVKKVLFSRHNCDGTPLYDGWYCRLHFNRETFDKWEPSIADVHTDPMTGKCLEVGVGETNLCVIAIDNEDQRRVYVGPIYSYYEFGHPITDRLTDEAWQKQLEGNSAPARPGWISAFQATQRPPSTQRLPRR